MLPLKNYWAALALFVIISLASWMPSASHTGHEPHPRHDHYMPDQSQQDTPYFNDPRVREDREHIKEDIAEYFKINADSLDKMTPADLEYYYFELHDFDKNKKLDGLEFLKAFQHVVEHTSPDEELKNMYNLEFYASAVDATMVMDDLDHDGYLTYEEYVYARRMAEARMQATS